MNVKQHILNPTKRTAMRAPLFGVGLGSAIAAGLAGEGHLSPWYPGCDRRQPCETGSGSGQLRHERFTASAAVRRAA